MLRSLSPHLSSEICYSDLCSCSFPHFPSLSRDPYVGSPLSFSPSVFRDLLLGSLLLLFTSLPLSLLRDLYVGSPLSISPVCLQRPVSQISALALFLSSPLCLSRDPYVGSPLSVSPFVFRELLLRSLLFLFNSLPLSFERSLCRFSTLRLPVCLQRCLSDFYPYVGSQLSVSPSAFRDLLHRSLLLLFSSFPFSLPRDPYVGSPLSVSLSVFRDVFLICIAM